MFRCLLGTYFNYFYQILPIGHIAHQTLDGATAVARSRRQQKNSSTNCHCQDPLCPQKSKSNRHKSKTRKSNKQNTTTGCSISSSKTDAKPHKSAPSSPVGTPKKISSKHNNKKHDPLDLNPQWIHAFPPVETPSEAGYPLMTSGKLTGCCGRTLAPKFKHPLSNSYSALDSTTSEDGGSHFETKTMPNNKKPVCFFCLHNFIFIVWYTFELVNGWSMK